MTDILKMLMGERQNRLSDFDEILSEDMLSAMSANGGKKGPVTFKADTLDKLLALANGEIGEDQSEDQKCDCLKCLINQRLAKQIYDGGENQDYDQVCEARAGAYVLLEITYDMERAFAYKRSSFETAARWADKVNLPVRAAALRRQLDSTVDYLENWIPRLHEEMPCYTRAVKESDGVKEEFESDIHQPPKAG